MTTSPRYRGRFAPTPSGPLHLGSLLTAVLSWLDARAHGGDWYLRIDDLDTARCSPQHTREILQQLQAHGLHWDGPVRYQSDALDSYDDALQQLCTAGLCFSCVCTRKTLRESARAGAFGPVYPGTCRARSVPCLMHAPERTAIRMRMPQGATRIADDWRGAQCYDWQQDIGDVILRRRDGIYGYALACAVDEARMGITHVVRGADLLAATPVHWHVMRCLGWTPPHSRHGPVVLRPDGAKLSKQNHARPIENEDAIGNLQCCLRWLGMPQYVHQETRSPEVLLQAAVAHWKTLEAPAALHADVCTDVAD